MTTINESKRLLGTELRTIGKERTITGILSTKILSIGTWFESHIVSIERYTLKRFISRLFFRSVKPSPASLKIFDYSPFVEWYFANCFETPSMVEMWLINSVVTVVNLRSSSCQRVLLRFWTILHLNDEDKRKSKNSIRVYVDYIKVWLCRIILICELIHHDPHFMYLSNHITVYVSLETEISMKISLKYVMGSYILSWVCYVSSDLSVLHAVFRFDAGCTYRVDSISYNVIPHVHMPKHVCIRIKM